MKYWIGLAVVLALPTPGDACNIPVFRYALERWKPDSIELVVFHDAPFSTEDNAYLQKLEKASSGTSRTLNAKLLKTDIRTLEDGAYKDLWLDLQEAGDVQLPCLVVRATASQRPINVWHGPLGEARKLNIVESPVRKELARRLLAGHSVVWLMLKSKDEAQNATVRKQLTSRFAAMQSELKLPEGVGLPGSELFSDVPLVLKFSILEIDPESSKEQLLVRWLSGFDPQAVEDDEPLMVPVFGRGRALEVIPASQLNDGLTGDLTQFLCAACSCQVKERNPGFDLLLNASWDKQLFGDKAGKVPAAIQTGPPRGRKPTLLTIPPGRKRK